MGTFGAFSTMSGKHHATGAQGGVVFTKDEDLYWRAKRFADRGKPFNITPATTNVVAGQNLNLNDLSAAIGRVQLKKLPAIVAGRRKAAEAIRAELAKKAKAVSVGWQVPRSESSYWFMRIHLDLPKLKVDKARFVAALGAEGVPASVSYRHIPSEAKWYRDRAVFGKSGWPWTCPAYKGDPDRKFPCPNAIESTDTHFNMSVHENYGEQEVRDIVEALLKVEKAYLK